MSDSPARLAAWIVEKFQRWSDCDGDVERRFTKDELLTNIMIYWATGSIGSSFLPYYELMHAGAATWMIEKRAERFFNVRRVRARGARAAVAIPRAP